VGAGGRRLHDGRRRAGWLHHGRAASGPPSARVPAVGSYKVPIAIGPGATVTVVIAPQARGRVVIDNPYGPAGGVAAATYHACQRGWTVFVQGFAFPDHRARGCVPLDVQAAGQPGTRHLTVSLFAGHCAS
jgi:hypothetical protein